MSRKINRTALAALSTAFALSLGACVGGPASLGGEPPLTPTSRYVLQVEPNLDRIALAVHDAGLSPAQAAALQALAGRYAQAEGGPLVIETPAGDDPVALNQAYAVQAALAGWGVPADRIRLASYAAPDPRAPVVVGFETVRAVVPQCGREWTNLTRTGNNAGSANFGCAVNANLAAQIANPRDIVAPRGMDAPDMGRRSKVFDTYRAGQRTAAPQEELVDGQVSRAVD